MRAAIQTFSRELNVRIPVITATCPRLRFYPEFLFGLPALPVNYNSPQRCSSSPSPIVRAPALYPQAPSLHTSRDTPQSVRGRRGSFRLRGQKPGHISHNGKWVCCVPSRFSMLVECVSNCNAMPMRPHALCQPPDSSVTPRLL